MSSREPPIEQPLSGEVALVTGAAVRVGRAIALELARAGSDIIIHYNHSAGAAESLKKEIGILGVRAAAFSANLVDPDECVGLVKHANDCFGKITLLVNNAAQFRPSSGQECEAFDEASWREMLETNLVAPARLCHLIAPSMSREERGTIVNIIDICADEPWPSHLAYCASKAGLANLTKGLARAVQPGVFVYGVAPGIVAFPESYPHSVRERLIEAIPLGRQGQPEDIARMVRFLACQRVFASGEVISVDGGRSLTRT